MAQETASSLQYQSADLDRYGWGMTDVPPGGVLDEDELALLDAVAAATLEGRTSGYETDPRLQPTGEIRSYSAAGFYTLSLP